MAEETTLLTKVIADIGGFLSPLKHAEEAVEGFFKGLSKGGFTGLTEGLGALAAGAGPLLGVAAAAYAVHKSFEAIGDAVQETEKWNLGAQKLSKQLGLTTQDASVLANALEDHGVGVEAYTTAQNFMIRALRTGSEGFQHLGVATRDSSGHLRPANAIMADAISKLNEMPDSTKKSIIGQSSSVDRG